MNLSQQAGLAAFQAVAAKCNSGSLTVYQGLMPANPETGIGSQALLATFSIAATAFPSVVFDTNGYQKGNIAFTANPVTPTASGTACFGRLLESNGTTVVADLTLAQGWGASLVVVQGQYIAANGNLYICTTAGTTASSGPGPTGTSTHIQDGGAYWMYLRPGTGDVLLSTAALSTGTPLNWPYLWLAMPCV